jgi:hypothetical protein
MYLAVMPQGGKLWRLKYRFGGKEKLMAIGKYPDLSLAQAREIHAEKRRLLAAGVDPMGRRKSEKTAERKEIENAFETIANHWIKHWKEDKSPRHIDSTRRRLDANILPSLGKLPTSEIVAPDIVCDPKNDRSLPSNFGQALHAFAERPKGQPRTSL